MAILSFRRLQGSTSTWAEGILQAHADDSHQGWSDRGLWPERSESFTAEQIESVIVVFGQPESTPKVSTSAWFLDVFGGIELY